MVGMLSGCVAPDDVTGEALVAWANGEGTWSVVSHLERCAACRIEVAEYARTAGVLRFALRRRCPEAFTIGEFVLGALLPAEMETLAAHIHACHACTRECHAIASFLDDADEERPETAPANGAVLAGTKVRQCLPLRACPRTYVRLRFRPLPTSPR